MKKLALALLFVLPLASAKADVFENFNLNWSGAPYGNSATVSAVLTLNMTTLVANAYVSSYSRDVSSLVMTVSGATSGNGTFGTADFNAMNFDVGPQNPFGPGGTYVLNSASQGPILVSDLNFWSSFNTAGTPNAAFYWMMRLGSGEYVSLSGVSGVPEPSSYVLGFAGLLGMVGFASSRKKKSEAAVAV